MATSTSGISGAAGSLQDQFLQLLIAQVQNQDPLNPVTDSEFISQLAQFNQLSGIQQLNASFSQMLQLSQMTQGTELIGRTVEYTPNTGSDTKTGKVNSVEVQDGKILLTIGGQSIGLDQVKSINA